MAMKDRTKTSFHKISAVEDFRDLSDQILNLANQDIPRFEFLHEFLKMLKSFSGCNSVGLRIKEKDKYLLCEITDASKQTLQIQIDRCVQTKDGKFVPYSNDNSSLELACRNVFLRQYHPALKCFTKKGSFWTGEEDILRRFLPKSKRAQKHQNLNIRQFYESIALVLICTGQNSFGILQLKSKKKNFFDERVIELYEEFAKISGIALSNQFAQAALRERVKELNCLYGLSKLAAQPDISLDEIFKSTVNMIPPAWQYPEITCARIVFKGIEYTTDNFKRTRWKQKAKINVKGITAGTCEVYYTKKKPEIEEGPFLKEEKDLLNAIASMLGSIVEYREAEEARAKLAAIVESSEDAIIGNTLDGIITSWNDGAERVYGYKGKEILGRSINILTTPGQPDEISKILKRIKRGESINNYETKRIRKDGENIDVSLSISPIKSIGGIITGASTIARDITNQRQSEEALRESEHALQERVKELTCLYNLALLAEEPGKSFEEILQGIAKLIPPAWQYPKITHGRILLDDQVYHSPGFKVGSQSQTAGIYVRGEKRGNIEVFYTKKMPEIYEGPFLKEERNLIDALAKQVGLIVERREAEKEKMRLQEQLRHADRLATIGQLAAGIAHELNEPLGNILGFAQLALKCEGISGQAEQDISKIVSASLYSREIIKKLMLFARQTPPKKTRVDLNDIVKEGIEFLKIRAAKERVKIICRLSSKLPKITADSAQLNQVLVNLVVNAIQAMPQGGTLTIQTASKKNRLILHVKDTGVGMSKEIMKNIFLPFYTTKDVGQGTGLGLAVVHGIVRSHGGTINVESQEGKGSCFEIQLPVRSASKKEKE